jgi:hypothetical protein
MKLVLKLTLLTSILIALVPVVAGQIPNQAPKPQLPNPEEVDRIHESVFSKTDKADEAGKLTEDASRALPGRAVSSGPIPRKNYIDEHIFGRI